MNYAYQMQPRRTDHTEKAKAKGRMLMSRQGNASKIVLTFLFCLLTAVAFSFVCDVFTVFLLPESVSDAAALVGAALSFTLYSMADVMLRRLGVRMERGRAEFFDMGKGQGSSGFAASAAGGLGALAVFSVIGVLVAYAEIFSRYVFSVLGETADILCMLLVVFIAVSLLIYLSTGLFFLAAVAEREKRGAFGLLRASFRAAEGNRMKIIKFFFSFAPVTTLSFLSLGVLFCVYVLPMYILSYGAFASEVLDDKEI